MSTLRLGDDDALERLLGEFARRQFARMPAHERAAWQRLDAPAGVPTEPDTCQDFPPPIP
jgi:hypothetical protein